MATCKNVFWNGPLGLYEKSLIILLILLENYCYFNWGNIITSVVGGGDTVAAK